MRTALTLSFAAGLWATAASASPKLNEPAPDFTLTDVAGKTHSLHEYKGKTVVLEWLNHGCPFVTKHYASGNMPKLQKDATGKGVVWLSIVSSAAGKQGYYPPAEQADLAKKKGSAATAVLLDEPGTVGHLYDARTTPHMFVIDPQGVLRYAGAIDSIPSADTDDLKRAEPLAAEAIDAVLAGKAPKQQASKPYGCSVKYKGNT
jgi:cytochrome oxidase Cu insertion factor (SCO1/SenC/PrrC family)